MRPPLLVLAALALAACGSSDRRSSPSDSGTASAAPSGPDAVLLRVPRAGGRVTAALYPRVDSLVWRSVDDAPSLARVLAFDGESALLSAVDAAGRPVRVDLRAGTVRTASGDPLTELASVGAGVFFGLARDGSVRRLTPSGDGWRLAVRGPVQQLYPQRDGSVIAAAVRGGSAQLWLLRPPNDRPADSATVTGVSRALRTGSADRIYLAGAERLVGVRSRDLEPAAPLALVAAPRAVVATPSGDRLYIAPESGGTLTVVDRFREAVAGTIELPGEVSELRIDPLGRYLLARPVRGDSVWVIAVGTDRLLGALRGSWRADLPAVLPDGAIATATGADVTFSDAASLRARRTVPGGAADFWHVVLWNGFRPRAAGLDQPVTFGGAGRSAPDSAATDSAAVDSLGTAGTDSATAPAPDTTGPAAPDTIPPRAARPTVPSGGEVVSVPLGRGYTVQYGAAEDERQARALATRVRGVRAARVVPTERAGQTLYRVVSGPYASHAEAERAARRSGTQYWIYQGAP